MSNFLEKIIREKKKEIGLLKALKFAGNFNKAYTDAASKGFFKKSVSRQRNINLIAEIKFKSPSMGSFGCRISPSALAKRYENSGAAAISVLTDKKFFGGNILHLMAVKEATFLPVLRKDFIIDESQVYESKAFGADAILLITKILPEKKLKRLFLLSRQLGMDAMIEVHSEEDLEKAIGVSPDIIGINNRDLETFRVDLEVTARLIKRIPKGIVKVSESGIKNYKDILFLKSIGADAVLVGEAFMRSKNVSRKILQLTGRDYENKG